MSLRIIRRSTMGITLEDRTMYQIQIDWSELGDLITKLCIANEVQQKLPPGGVFHPACIVEEYIQSQDK